MSAVASKPFGPYVPSSARRRLNGDRSAVRYRHGGGAAHVEPVATIAVSPGAGVSVQSTRARSRYQTSARVGVHGRREPTRSARAIPAHPGAVQ
jgi:hypothetical protein